MKHQPLPPTSNRRLQIPDQSTDTRVYTGPYIFLIPNLKASILSEFHHPWTQSAGHRRRARSKILRKLPTHNDNDILKRSRHVLFILGVNQKRRNAALIDPCARSQGTIYRS